MKKLLALGLSLVMILSLAACGTTEPSTAAPTEAPTTKAPEPTQAPTTTAPTTVAPTTVEPTTAEPVTVAPTTEPVPEVKVLSYEEYMAAEMDSEVTIEAFVQFSAYNAEHKNTNLFLADAEGAYFVYRMNVTPEQAAQLKEGTKIRVSGFKGEWAGEVEFAEASATFEVIEGESFITEPKDVTALFGTEELITLQNQKISIADAVVAPSQDADGKEQAFLYKWNGSGADGDDLYFNVIIGEETYTLTVESDECGAGTDVYEAVKALKIGQIVDLEGFLYWYEGPQPHVHKLTNKGERAMTHEEFWSAAVDSEVIVEGWIQLAAYNETNDNICLFLADADGAYYIWRMNVTAEEAAQLSVGTKIRVRGMKTVWSGEVEVEDASFELLEAEPYLSEAKDISALISKEEELEPLMNSRICLVGMTVVASKDADENEHAFLYKYNGSGQEGDDLYFTVSLRGREYVFTVESDEHPLGSEVYTAVQNLQIGDVIDVEGFLYWYNGAQPHVSAVKPSEAKSDVAMTYEEFAAAELDTAVVVDGFIQWTAYDAERGTANLFLVATSDYEPKGAYYVYQMPVTPEEAETLQQWTHIRVKGFKNEWSGEVEITDATFEILSDEGYQASSVNISDRMADEEALRSMMNMPIFIEGAYIVPSLDADGNEQAFLYKWNGSGAAGENCDLYFNISVGGLTYTVTVESDECPEDSAVYTAVTELKIGQGVDLEGFLYWYEGPQPHINWISTERYEKASEEVMNYYEYLQAEKDAEVIIEGQIRLVSTVKDGKVNLYLFDGTGAYYVYGMAVEEADLAEFEAGKTSLRIKGFKSVWSGEVEITDATYEIIDDQNIPGFVVEWTDLKDDEMKAAHQNWPVRLSYAAIVPSVDKDGNKVPFLYKWNGSGEEGDDLYFKVLVGGEYLTVTVESDEFGADTDVYRAVQDLQIGDVVNLEGILYWYEGPQPHITAVEKVLVKGEGVMTHAEFMAAEDETPAVVEGFVQLVSAYNEEYGTCSVYLDDVAGAYYIYRLAVTSEEYALLKPGLFIRVSGYRGTWSGEVELVDASGFEIPDEDYIDPYLAKPINIVDIPDMEAAEAFVNSLVCGKGAKIVASKDADGNDKPFLYSWNGSGQDGDDIYFNVEIYSQTYTVTVDTDEIPAGSEVYETVKGLEIGDIVDLEGFLYWYEGPQPHVTKITVIPAE